MGGSVTDLLNPKPRELRHLRAFQTLGAGNPFHEESTTFGGIVPLK